MSFQDDCEDTSEAEFIRPAFKVRIRRSDTGEIVQTLEFPELRIPASERLEEEQG